MNARFYDPELGRFASPDSIIAEPYNPQSLDRYAFTFNDPTNHSDPSGHIPRDIELKKEQEQQGLLSRMDVLPTEADQNSPRFTPHPACPRTDLPPHPRAAERSATATSTHTPPDVIDPRAKYCRGDEETDSPPPDVIDPGEVLVRRVMKTTCRLTSTTQLARPPPARLRREPPANEGQAPTRIRGPPIRSRLPFPWVVQPPVSSQPPRTTTWPTWNHRRPTKDVHVDDPSKGRETALRAVGTPLRSTRRNRRRSDHAVCSLPG